MSATSRVDDQYLQVIGSSRRPAISGATWEVIDPASEEVVGLVPYGDARDVALAVDAAEEAMPRWAATPAPERAAVLAAAGELLTERADRYGAVTTEESGKPLAQAIGEWAGAAAHLRFHGEAAVAAVGREVPSGGRPVRIAVGHRPVGIVGVITAWNYPVYNVNRTVAAALAAGCAVVIRPSELTARSAILYAQTLLDAGVPPGVVNVVVGEPVSMGRQMLDDRRVAKISFTGSTRVGRSLMDGASATVTRLALELGGNAPVVVLADVEDVDAVGREAVRAKLRNSGQVCAAPQRFFVHAAVYDQFVAAAREEMRAQLVGPGSDPAVTVGPLISARQRRRVEDLVARSVQAGARVLDSYDRPLPRRGFFVAPTVLVDVQPSHPVMTEEIFGPVMPVMPFDDLDEAIELANAGDHGLAAFVQCGDVDHGVRVAQRLVSGMIGVNEWFLAAPGAPFGGTRASGIGRESGLEGLHEYMEPLTLYVAASSEPPTG